MYESFYHLSANPFRLVPDARLFYASSVHKRGLAYLRYGLHQGQGFVVVTGKPGTGKSTLVQTLFSDMSGESMVMAGLTSTNLGADDVLQAVGHSFDVYGDGKSKASLLIEIENFLKTRARMGKRVVLIVDEAQNLPQKSLEELRMLSNFQLGDQPLLQILLLGQQQLREVLARPDLEQLSQRVIASCHLKPLDAEDMRGYVAHRLQCVGWKGDPSISGEALALVYSASQGVPRLINIFCDRLFLAASLEERHDIDKELAESVLAELKEESTGSFALCEGSDCPPLPDLESLTEADVPAAAAASEEEVDEMSPPGAETKTAVAEEQPSSDAFEPTFSKARQKQADTNAPAPKEKPDAESGSAAAESEKEFNSEPEGGDYLALDLSESQPQRVAEEDEATSQVKKWLALLFLFLAMSAAAIWFVLKGGKHFL
jgi:general secretion pathway protein A